MAGVKGRSGRKPQSENIEMIERLTPLDPIAFEELKKGIERGEFKYVQMFYHYYYGKPRQAQDITINSETPIFNI